MDLVHEIGMNWGRDVGVRKEETCHNLGRKSRTCSWLGDL